MGKLPERIQLAIVNNLMFYWHLRSETCFELRIITEKLRKGGYKSRAAVGGLCFYFRNQSSVEKARKLESWIIEAGGHIEHGSLDRFIDAWRVGPRWVERRTRNDY